MAGAAELEPGRRAGRAAAASVEAVLLAVVDSVALTARLVVCGRVEASLATAAYGGVVEDAEGGATQTLALPGLVSRKKDFVPALTKAVTDGWAPPEAVVQEHEEAQAKTSADDAEEPRSKAGGMKRSRSMNDVAQGDVVVDYSDEPSGKLVRLAS